MLHKLPQLDPRIPSWDLLDLVERDCPTCGATKRNPICKRPDDLIINFCETCKSYFVSPAPSTKQIEKFYAGYDANHRPTPPVVLEDLKELYASDDPLVDLRVKVLSSLAELKGRRLLEIGFGRGYFLNCFRRLGCIIEGTEIDPEAIALGRSLGFHKVYHGKVEDLPTVDSFDVVVMIDLIEHPLEPLSILEKAISLLKPGGFVLISTPNGGLAEKNDSVTLRVDLEHMQYWSAQTLHFICSKYPLDVVHLETFALPALDILLSPVRPQLVRKRNFLIRRIKNYLKRSSAVLRYMHLKDRLVRALRDERNGNYILFTVMQKRA
jgi:2-polyprenyl-3-methyl-5-hydroxy-6-metoxy-1,4-benzoquinol methylase